jgi:hypothetical protein
MTAATLTAGSSSSSQGGSSSSSSSGEHLPAESARCCDDISLNCFLPVLLPAHEVELHIT